MVYTRKKRPNKTLTFSTGGAVPMPENIDPPPPPPAYRDDTEDAIKQALEAQRRAEELARNARRHAEELAFNAAKARTAPPTIEEQIDAIPNLSEANRQWLKKYPRLIDPNVMPLAQRAYQIALAEGIEADSDEMRDRITMEVTADLERLEKARSGALRFDPQPEPEDEPEPAYEPPPSPAVVAASRPVPPVQASHAPPRRSVPVSAPVSRDPPTSSGRRQSSESQITLTAEERQIAHNSFGAVNGAPLSNDEKERLYAFNKRRYQQMLASGEYSRQTDR